MSKIELGPKDKRYLDLACGVATTSRSRMKHGALIVKHSKILGVSPNIFRNNPRNVKDPRDASIHAEIASLRKAGFPKRATVFVARVNNFGKRRLSMPCQNCQAVIESLKCRVVWTENE